MIGVKADGLEASFEALEREEDDVEALKQNWRCSSGSRRELSLRSGRHWMA